MKFIRACIGPGRVEACKNPNRKFFLISFNFKMWVGAVLSLYGKYEKNELSDIIRISVNFRGFESIGAFKIPKFY